MSSSLMDKKINYWEHKLLDLGKRNKMINYRETKRTTLKLIEPSIDELFKRLAINEETLSFQRSVDRENDLRVFSILSLLENLSYPLPVTIGDIKTESSILERQKTLKNMRSKARLSLEEQGTNILYLSFGFIEWKDGKGLSAQWIKSPLILVPTILALEALNSPYTLSKHEDDIVVNPTLEYYLKTEYGIELPKFDAEKDTLDDFFTEVEKIADQRGWKIKKEVSLGLLSFLKISMYNDLLKNEERIKNNSVIKAMSGDLNETNNISDDLDTFDLDSIKPIDCYQVMSADSSQQDAILYSKNNISFVMQGPPGTGKSQTITNIISEALAEGKKVLFVSEKMAALQVVYRRLQEAHLADFCLPLHSYKANKKEILEQIGANLKLKQTKVKDTAINSLEELDNIRKELDGYAEELHRVVPELNISCYEAYSKLVEISDAQTLSFRFDNPLSVSHAQLLGYTNKLKQYSLAVQRIDYKVKNNPWDGLKIHSTGFEYSERIKQEMNNFKDFLLLIEKYLNEIYCNNDICERIDYSSIPKLIEAISQLCDLPKVPNSWFNGPWVRHLKSSANAKKAQYEKLWEIERNIDNVFNIGIYDYKCNEWKDKLLAIASGLVCMPYFSTYNSYYYFSNANVLFDLFVELKCSLKKISEEFLCIGETIDAEVIPNEDNYRKIAELYSIICNNYCVLPKWISCDLNKTKEIVAETKTVCEQIESTRERVLKEWEPEIFELDYTSILARFKTEYTSFFKIFNSQYRKDKKQIQALSKSILKKLTDDVAYNLLVSVKYYNNQHSWFVEHEKALIEAIGVYYKGKETDWDSVLRAIDCAQKLKDFPEKTLLKNLYKKLSKDHKDLINKLNASLDCIAKEIANVKKVLDVIEFKSEIDILQKNVCDEMNIIEEYIEKLDSINEQLKNIKPFLKSEETDIKEIFDAINEVDKYRKLNDDLNLKSEIDSCKNNFGFFFKESKTNWDEIIDLLNKIEKIIILPIYEKVQPLVHSCLEQKEKLSQSNDALKRVYLDSVTSYEWLAEQFDEEKFEKTKSIELLHEKVSNCLSNIGLIEGWIDYQEAKEDCNKEALGDFISKVEDIGLYSEIEKLFLKGFYSMWLEAMCNRLDSVRRFRKNAQIDRVKKFEKLDSLQLLIAQMRIREKLIADLPAENKLVKATDEVAILNKELGKKRNIMPLRKLFRLIPNLLMKLKPCLMMSPLSVSYFLETEAYHFDLVIFDEASQIFPEDAIGAIFRGAQVIIAGDSKQLPPTNFFAASTNNFDGEYDIGEEDDYDEVVSDSILEESASVLPNRTLLWHYRSKHESLIAFSNQEIYKNSLITFPNSITKTPDMGVEYIYVENGCYEGGGKNCNIREAQKCVMLVLDHIHKHPDRSLGIIAFSEKQQNAIENAIIDFREMMPQYEWFFDETKEEPFFVKNLENVQGDERDTIIFSICYAKDRNGKMYMRFGPLGHEGGERRLNVAITRAKCNVKLVGSILPSDIDLSRTNSEGVKMLKSYMEFARKGTNALKPTEKTEDFETEDDFCKMIVSFLQAKGYKVQTKVGCSDYKIDIAIENPDNEGEFIAGIECDGLSYIKAKTARDRDHLRKSVLENMGWNLYRVWSTEWVRNPEAESKALVDFIESVSNKNGIISHSIKQSNENTSLTQLEQIAIETEKKPLSGKEGNPYNFEIYKEANWWEAPHSGSHDNMTRVGECVLHVVSIEQPIHMDILYKRLGPSFTTGKATEAVKQTILRAIWQNLKGKVIIDKDQYARMVPVVPPVVRVPGKYDTPRPIEYIHTEEVAAAMFQIINRSYGITTEDLSTECARIFGFERKGPKIRQKMDAAINYLVTTGKIKIIDEKIQKV